MESPRIHTRDPKHSRDGMEVHQEFSNDPIYLTISALRNFRIAAADALGLRATRLPTGLIDAGGLPVEIHLLRRDLTCDPERDEGNGDLDPFFNSTYFPVKDFDKIKTKAVIKFIQDPQNHWKIFSEYARKRSGLSSVQIAAAKIAKISESTTNNERMEGFAEIFDQPATEDEDLAWKEAGKLLHHWLVSLFSRLPICGQITKPLFNRMRRKLTEGGQAREESGCSCLGFLVHVKKSKGSKMPKFQVFDLVPPGCPNPMDLNVLPPEDDQPDPQIKEDKDLMELESTAKVVESLYIEYLIHLFYNESFEGKKKVKKLSGEATWFLFLPLYDSWNPETGFEGTFRGWLFGNYPNSPVVHNQAENDDCDSNSNPYVSRRHALMTDLLDELLIPARPPDVHGSNDVCRYNRALIETKEDVLKSISSQAAILLLASERLSDSLRRAEQDAVLGSRFDENSSIPELISKNLHQLEGWHRFDSKGEESEGDWKFYEDFPRGDYQNPFSYLAVNLNRQWPETGEGEVIRIKPDDTPLTIIPDRNLVSSEIFFDNLASRLRRLYSDFTSARAKQQEGQLEGRISAGREHHWAMAHELRKTIHRIASDTPPWALNILRSYYRTLTVYENDFDPSPVTGEPWLTWGALDRSRSIQGSSELLYLWPKEICNGSSLEEWLKNHAFLAIQLEEVIAKEGNELPLHQPRRNVDSDFIFDCSIYALNLAYTRSFSPEQYEEDRRETLKPALGFACALVCAFRNVLQNKNKDPATVFISHDPDQFGYLYLKILNNGKSNSFGKPYKRGKRGGTLDAIQNFVKFYAPELTPTIRFHEDQVEGKFETPIPIPKQFLKNA